MADTTIPGTALVPTGKVTHCCGLHKPGDWFSCCDLDDCRPCCEKCPSCPNLALAADFARDLAAIEAVTTVSLAAAVAALLLVTQP